jgi:hypothetical protein
MKDFLIVKKFITADQCGQLADKIDLYVSNGYTIPDNQCPNSPSFYGIFNDESILFLPFIEELLGKKLSPTYTYARLYQPGELLLPHKDRTACEHSFTLSIKTDKEPWPFYLETSHGIEEILLEDGDMLVYNGVQDLHWRMRLTNQFQYQGFFHYVDQAGPYADKKNDGHDKFLTTNEAIEHLRNKNVLQ